jgi:hypothetical protein
VDQRHSRLYVQDLDVDLPTGSGYDGAQAFWGLEAGRLIPLVGSERQAALQIVQPEAATRQA